MKTEPTSKIRNDKRNDAAGIARLFLVLLHRAETPQRLQARLVRAHAETNVLFGLHVDVKADLGIQSAIEIAVTNQGVNSFPHLQNPPGTGNQEPGT